MAPNLKNGLILTVVLLSSLGFGFVIADNSLNDDNQDQTVLDGRVLHNMEEVNELVAEKETGNSNSEMQCVYTEVVVKGYDGIEYHNWKVECTYHMYPVEG